MSSTTTLMRRSANLRAICSPIPLQPPVIRITSRLQSHLSEVQLFRIALEKDLPHMHNIPAVQSVLSIRRLQVFVGASARKDLTAGCSCTFDLRRSINSSTRALRESETPREVADQDFAMVNALNSENEGYKKLWTASKHLANAFIEVEGSYLVWPRYLLFWASGLGTRYFRWHSRMAIRSLRILSEHCLSCGVPQADGLLSRTRLPLYQPLGLQRG